MDLTATMLPDDIDALKAMVLARDEHVATLQERLSSRETEIEHLKLILAKLRRMQFGRKSEKLERQIEQLELRLEDLQADEGAADAAEPKKARQPRETTARKSLPDHLEREERVHQPAADNCPDCGGTLKPLGEDVSEQLEYVRAHFRVIRHRRPKLACSCCDCIVQAAAPSRPIDRGLPGPALLAHITTSKFAYHIPFYRQSVMYARDGVEIEPGTIGHWLGSLAWLLNPLVDAVRRYALGGTKVHADDTPLPVLAPSNGRTKTGRLWVYVRDDRPSGSTEAPAVWFAYTPDRRGEHPQQHLADFTGVLQADAFAGYAELYRSGRIQEAACMAHYLELHFMPSLMASTWRTQPLHVAERDINPQSERVEKRQEVRRGLPGLRFARLNPRMLPECFQRIAFHLEVCCNVAPCRRDTRVAKVVANYSDVCAGLQ